MDIQSSRIQKKTRKKNKIGCGDETPADLLLEIFIRIPDFRSAIRTASVCRNWHSLISQNPKFIPRFESHHHRHQHRYPLPFTIFFRKADFEHPQFTGPQNYQPICKLFSDQEPMFCSSPNFLDFMPSSMVIRGSWNDLLLVSTGPRDSKDLYICNPITKQFIQLPEIPRPHHGGFERGVAGHALVCLPPGPTNKFRFKVVELARTIYPNPNSELPHDTLQPTMLFCSESRKWEPRQFFYPRPTIQYAINWLHGVACNGILYWLEFERCEINRVLYLDLSSHQCGVIGFPDDSCVDFRCAKDQIGVVYARGGGEDELRLLQVVPTTGVESTVDLKVWKLSAIEKEWILVHHKMGLEKKSKLVRPKNTKMFELEEALPFVHPTNGDMVFIVWGRKVFQYNLKDTSSTTEELICKLQEPLVVCDVFKPEAPRDRLLQFPLMQMNWPTQIYLP